MTTPDHDGTRLLQEAVRAARAESTPLRITGGGSKAHLFGRPCEARELSVAGHRGIVSYRPEEMIITARAGTTIAELVAATAEHGQILPFEPAVLDGKSTLGGTLATGISGPARPWRGSVRDAVLGIRLINGHGEELRFGGEVIKNVAGYDVSRLQAGALGTLGVISEVSLKLLPRPAQILYLSQSTAQDEAIRQMRRIARKPWPLTGLFWRDGSLQLRLEGSASAMASARANFTDFQSASSKPWEDLRELRLDEFAIGASTWMLDLAPAAPPMAEIPATSIDWAGARRYMSGAFTEEAVTTYAADFDGSVQRLGMGMTSNAAPSDHREPTPAPAPAPVMQSLLLRVKNAMDPDHMFNPGRLYDWM